MSGNFLLQFIVMQQIISVSAAHGKLFSARSDAACFADPVCPSSSVRPRSPAALARPPPRRPSPLASLPSDDDEFYDDAPLPPLQSRESPEITAPFDAPFDRSSKWILVVDDELPLRRAVTEYLRSAGYAVSSFPDVSSALSSLRTGRRGRPPDCIVSDVRMPEIDGLEFLAILRDGPTQSLPVVLLTARGMTADRIAGYRAGADAYLPKPFDPDELLSVVDGTIERQRQMRGENVDLAELRNDVADIRRVMSKGGPVGNMVVRTDVWLTRRERDVLNLLGRGYSNREIANELGLGTPDAISGYCKAMMKKASVSTRSELLRWALDTGNVQ